MYAPEVLDMLDCDLERLVQLGLHDGFPLPYEIPSEGGVYGWYRHEVEAWFAELVIAESCGA